MQAESEQLLERIADRLKAMADPMRLRILHVLQDGERCVTDILGTSAGARPTSRSTSRCCAASGWSSVAARGSTSTTGSRTRRSSRSAPRCATRSSARSTPRSARSSRAGRRCCAGRAVSGCERHPRPARGPGGLAAAAVGGAAEARGAHLSGAQPGRRPGRRALRGRGVRPRRTGDGRRQPRRTPPARKSRDRDWRGDGADRRQGAAALCRGCGKALRPVPT